MGSNSSSGFRPGALHISLRTYKTQQIGWKKGTNEQTRAWVGSKCKKGEVFATLLSSSACIFAGYRGRIFAWNFHKATSNADSSLDGLLCPVSIFSRTLSADFILLWTAISSRLFSTALLCQLTLSVFSGTFLPSSTFGLELWPFVWVSHQNRQIDPLSGININGNKRLPIVSYIYVYTGVGK